MKKGTKIAFAITLVYCLIATYTLYNGIYGNFSTPDWIDGLFYWGYFLGLPGIFSESILLSIIGQIITFIILFFILKTLINSIFFRKKELK